MVVAIYYIDDSADDHGDIDSDDDNDGGGDGGDDNGGNFEAPGCGDRVLGALRRGWIQQEVRFGALSHTVVAPFVRNCLVTREFALLGSFLRRRASALSWLFEGARLEPSYADMADEERANYSFQEQRAEALMGLHTFSSPSKGERSNVSEAIDSWVLSNLGEFSPAANEEFQRSIAHLDPGELGAEKAAAAHEHAARVAIDAALDALRAVLPAVPR